MAGACDWLTAGAGEGIVACGNRAGCGITTAGAGVNGALGASVDGALGASLGAGIGATGAGAVTGAVVSGETGTALPADQLSIFALERWLP